MDEIGKWYFDQLAARTIKALETNGFEASYVESREQAVQAILDRLTPGMVVGVGGSLSIRELDVLPRIKNEGYKVLDHWAPDLASEEVIAIRRGQLTCDLLLTSSNAVTAAGELVNIDGIGNRAAAMIFGPRRVMVVVGVNKLVKDCVSALNRIHELAAPMRAKSLNLETPCARLGVCTNCNHPQRICRATVILERRPALTEIEIIIVREYLGY